MSTIEPWLREILRCPQCRSELRDDTGPDGAELGLHQRRVRLGVSLRRRHTGPAHRRGLTPRMTRP